MRYDLKAIMSRAWEIKRMDREYLFGACLSMAWAEAKQPKTYKNAVIKEYGCFNERRYSDPWVALVDDRGKLDFSKEVGSYTGGFHTGCSGVLYVYAPVEGQVYAYGQKDRRGNNGGYWYVQFVNGEFIKVPRTELLSKIAC